MAAHIREALGHHLFPITSMIQRARFRLRGSSLARQVALRRSVSLGIAVVVAVTAHSAITSADKAKLEWGTVTRVVVTTAEIDAGKELTRSMLRIVEVPQVLAPPAALTVMPVGRRVRGPLGRNEIVTDASIAEPKAGSVASMLSPGTQAVTLALGDSAAPVSPGDLVDIYGHVPEGGSEIGLTDRVVLVARSAAVMVVGDSTATVAVTDAEVPKTVESTASGPPRLVIIG